MSCKTPFGIHMDKIPLARYSVSKNGWLFAASLLLTEPSPPTTKQNAKQTHAQKDTLYLWGRPLYIMTLCNSSDIIQQRSLSTISWVDLWLASLTHLCVMHSILYKYNCSDGLQCFCVPVTGWPSPHTRTHTRHLTLRSNTYTVKTSLNRPTTVVHLGRWSV